MRTTRSLAYGFPLALLTLATLACNSPEARAQDDGDEVPAAVDAELRAKYPDATDVDWGVDRNDNYEAHIEVQGVKMRVDISPAGEWIETERSVDYDELPEAVRATIEREFDEDDIEELEHTVNKDKGEFYDVELDPKGEKKFDVMIAKDGRILGREG